MNKFVVCFKKVGFQLQKHSPEILVAVGVVGVVGAAVMACKATTKVSAILDKCRDDVNTAKDLEANQGVEEYTHEDAVKDVTVYYIQTAVNLAKLYAPAVGVGALSLACILKSTDILRKRNAALAAAYATISQGFKEYRGRVVEKYGADVDRELKHGLTSVDGENDGKINVISGVNEQSDYARVFDKKSNCWENSYDRNLFFLRAQQQWANDKLRANGYLFLNDVYDSVGIPRSKAGQIVGWVYNADKPNGDNYVDFGLFDVRRERNNSITSGFDLMTYEDAILLDFNVDGDIWSLMK